MEGVAPLYRSLNDVEYSLVSGKTVLRGLEDYVDSNQNEWARFLKEWLTYQKNNKMTEQLERKLRSPHRRTALLLFSSGIRGQSILREIQLLKNEVEKQSDLEIDEFLRLLPYKMMVPILVFLFPALMTVLLGPIVETLSGAL